MLPDDWHEYLAWPGFVPSQDVHYEELAFYGTSVLFCALVSLYFLLAL